jgi:serine O-acetyltransferase
MLSDFRKDYDRYAEGSRRALLEPSLAAVLSYRLGQWCSGIRAPVIGPVLRAAHVVLHCFITLSLGIHLPRGACIGPGLHIYHFGGIVVSHSAIIGSNCTLRQNVCIGTRYGSDDAPSIGDNVEFGVGAVVIGRIRIGNNVRIGANAVVLSDVPDNSTAVGVPARVVSTQLLNEKEYLDNLDIAGQPDRRFSP